jgi:hypothetical protein
MIGDDYSVKTKTCVKNFATGYCDFLNPLSLSLCAYLAYGVCPRMI